MGITLNYTAIDIETTSLQFKTGRILGVGVVDQYYKAGDVAPIGLEPHTAHNGKFEYKYLRANNFPFNWQFDTLLASSILIDRPQDLDLASVAQHYLGMDSWKSDTDKLFKKKNWVELLEADPKLQEALAARNVYDLKATTELTQVLQHRLEKEGMTDFFFTKLMPAARLLADVEYRGMRINVEETKKQLTQIEEQIGQLKTRLTSWLGGINFNSPIQLKKVLRDKGYDLWIWDFKKKAMVESTGTESLERLLPNENIQILIDYKAAIKLKGFLQGWVDDQIAGYIYPSYNIANTRTGRLSCSQPNLQQIPRDKSIRSLFIPSPEKVFVIGDYAQIEVRVAAHYTQDEALTQVFKDGIDFYGSIAINVLGVKCHPNDVKKLYPKERRVAKEIGLSILYGIGAAKLSSQIRKKAGVIISKEKCAQIIKDYFIAYPRLLQFRNYIINKIENGEILKTKYGRQYRIDPSKAFSTGVNTLVQGTATDACLFSQIKIDEELKKLGIDAPLICIVHDEIIRECSPEHTDTVGRLAEQIMCDQGFDCPIKFEWGIGKSWGDKL
jgi:DNA polymerase-1